MPRGIAPKRRSDADQNLRVPDPGYLVKGVVIEICTYLAFLGRYVDGYMSGVPAAKSKLSSQQANPKMPSRSTPNLGTYGEKPGLFQSRTTRPSTPSQSKPTLAILSPPPTSAHVSPPYGHFSSPSKKSRPLLRTRHSVPSNPHATAEKQARAHSYPPRKLSLPLVAKGSFVVSARPMLSRLRSGLGRLFAKKGEEESEESEKCETDAASLHLELPEWVSRDKSEIEYLRRMEREALSGRENGIVV